MSSTDTVGPSCLPAPSRKSTADVAVLMPHTSGRVRRAKSCITGAAILAKASARRRASRLGTSSPKSSVTNESSITNTVSAIVRLAAAIAGGACAAIQAARSSTRWSPP